MLFFGCRERLAQGRGVAVFQSFTKPDLIPETFVRRSGRCGKRIGRNALAGRQRPGPHRPFRLRRTPRSNLFGGNFPNLPENAIFAADKSTL